MAKSRKYTYGHLNPATFIYEFTGSEAVTRDLFRLGIYHFQVQLQKDPDRTFMISGKKYSKEELEHCIDFYSDPVNWDNFVQAYMNPAKRKMPQMEKMQWVFSISLAVLAIPFFFYLWTEYSRPGDSSQDVDQAKFAPYDEVDIIEFDPEIVDYLNTQMKDSAYLKKLETYKNSDTAVWNSRFKKEGYTREEAKIMLMEQEGYTEEMAEKVVGYKSKN